MNNLQRLAFLVILVSALCVTATAVTRAGQQTDAQVSESNQLIQTGVALLEQNKLDEGLSTLNKASQLNPKDFRPHALSGLAYMAQMKLKSASEAFARAISLQPNETRLYLLKATADVRRSASDEAIKTSRQALAIDPNYAEAYAMIGEALRWDKERSAEAIAALQTAIKIKPELPSSYETLGNILKDGKDEKAAEEVFRKGMGADPKRMSGRFALGRMLVKQGRLTEAREIWVGRTSEEDNTMPRFIDLLERAEKLKRATDALAEKPDNPDAILEMGLAVMEGDSWVFDNRQKRAIEYFRKALTLRPNFARAQHAIVKAYIQIANVFKDENKNVDREMALLKKLDAKLADELEEYRKRYQGGIITTGPPVKVDQ